MERGDISWKQLERKSVMGIRIRICLSGRIFTIGSRFGSVSVVCLFIYIWFIKFFWKIFVFYITECCTLCTCNTPVRVIQFYQGRWTNCLVHFIRSDPNPDLVQAGPDPPTLGKIRKQGKRERKRKIKSKTESKSKWKSGSEVNYDITRGGVGWGKIWQKRNEILHSSVKRRNRFYDQYKQSLTFVLSNKIVFQSILENVEGAAYVDHLLILPFSLAERSEPLSSPYWTVPMNANNQQVGYTNKTLIVGH